MDMEQQIKKRNKKETIIFIVSALLMLIPIILVIINPGSVGKEIIEVTSGGILGFGAKKGKEVVATLNESPFAWDGLAAVFGCILYTIVLLRNKNTLYQFNKDNLDFKVLILHFLNLIFLVSAMSLFTKNNWYIFGLSPAYFMIAAIAFSVVSMKTLSGYMWIVTIILAMFNVDVFNKWQGYSTIYVVSAYASLICQVFLLNIFDFDVQNLIKDFSAPTREVAQNINVAVDTTVEGAKKIASATGSVAKAGVAAAKATTGLPPV